MTTSTIGKDTVQINALEKVLGKAQYSADLKMAGMLHAKVLRSPYAHAKIVRVDADDARALPGVHAVLTGEDTPTRMTGIHHKQHRILATGKVRFIGEEVVAVVAEDEETARDAIDLIRVEYEELPVVLDPDQALQKGTIEVHDGSGNLACQYNVVRGDVDAAFARAALVHEDTYETHSQYPGYLEPMATLAWRTSDGRVNVYTSTQSAFLARMRLADALEMPVSKVRVIQATVGGGFGGKTAEECNSLICAWLATRVDRPVRFVNNRLEDFLGARSSPPERIRLKMGVDKDGIIIAKEVNIIAECGAYEGLAGHVLQVSTVRSDNMHRHLKDVRLHSKLVYTNTPPRGALRGFGGPQSSFALNSHITVMADKLGLDPVEMMKRNAIQSGETSVHGFQIGSSGLGECLEQVERGHSLEREARSTEGHWREAARHRLRHRHPRQRQPRDGQLGRLDGHARMGDDGRVVLLTGESDMGQGANTMLAQCFANELSIPLAHVTVLPTDTDMSPYGHRLDRLARHHPRRQRRDQGGTRGARQAARHCFREAWCPGRRTRHGPRRSVREIRGAEPEDPVDRPGAPAHLPRGRRRPAGDRDIRSADLPGAGDTGAVRQRRAGLLVRGAGDRSRSRYRDRSGRRAGHLVSDDCGKALNPLAVHGQSCGAAVMAIGWTLYEHLQYDNCGLLNGNFADYTMPTADSVPLIHSGIVESNEPNGPYGAKGASETAILPGAAAIANAVYDAIGVRIKTLPITPEKILAGSARTAEAAAQGAAHA